MTELRRSAVSWVEQNGLVLCVWNDRFNGWTMPGGMVEPGETLEQAQARELFEETHLRTVEAKLVYRAQLRLPPPKQDRSSDVHFFKVVATGNPQPENPGRPVDWLSWDKLCEVSPFREFYVAARIAAKHGIVEWKLDG
jgi:8-oxo-dGTP diphosphatase